MKNRFFYGMVFLWTLFSFVSRSAFACACGCGVFDVATSSMLPEGKGGTAFFEYDYQDQNQNRRGTSKVSADDNDDKELRTHFFTTGYQYMFDRSWGVQVEVPYANRYFKKGETDPDTGDTTITTLDWSDMGDIRIRGIYTGFSPDMSTGVNFGFKLPTGNYTHNDADGNIDRDTEIGTGSTDVLLGGYHRGSLTADNVLSWFAQAQVDLPAITRDGYRPGTEFSEALGINYNGWSIGTVKITPVGQVIGSQKTKDTGINSADPVASGYNRILLSPGLEVDIHPVMVYADVEFPVYQDMRGDQLVAPVLVKVVASYKF